MRLLASALALGLCAALPANAIEVLNNPQAHAASQVRHSDVAAVPSAAWLSAGQGSELPEPEVFAMMLLGLLLIGYRATRDSSEPFT